MKNTALFIPDYQGRDCTNIINWSPFYSVITLFPHEIMFTFTGTFSLFFTSIFNGSFLKKSISIEASRSWKWQIFYSRLWFIVINNIILCFKKKKKSSNIFCIFACNSRYEAQCAPGVMETISLAAFEKCIVCLAMHCVVLYCCTSAHSVDIGCQLGVPDTIWGLFVCSRAVILDFRRL